MKLSMLNQDGRSFFYRAGKEEVGSDYDSYIEVVEQGCYFKKFDVERGEKWLDLGANIGSFAHYAKLKKAAEVVCFEPDPECFKVLALNAFDCTLVPAAVSGLPSGVVDFSGSPNPDNHWRGTVVEAPDRYVSQGKVMNLCADFLKDQRFDGVKVDIEGAEGALLDEWLLPKCEKLCMEYHFSRMPSQEDYNRRVAEIRDRFNHFERLDTGYKDIILVAWN